MMDVPDRTEMPSSGNGSHGGVHRCHKCGWRFPNPHPSGKDRRSHKKACGTLEGYKLLHSATASDDLDNHRSDDEDHKVTDVVESTSNAKSIRFSGTGPISIRSTDEVFSDATPEFQDYACSYENERGEGDTREVGAGHILERDLSGALSFKDCSDADILESPRYSTDGSQEQSPFVQHSIPNLPQTPLNCQNVALNSSKESLHMPMDDRNGSMKALVPAKSEKEMDVLEDRKRLHAVETAEESSACGHGTKPKACEQRKLMHESAFDVHADQASQAESYSSGRVEITSAAVMTDGYKELKQEFTGGLGASIAVPTGETVRQEGTKWGDHKTTSETIQGNMTVLNCGHGEMESETAFTSEQREASPCRENHFQLKEEGNGIFAPSRHIGDLPSESVDAAITSQVKKDFPPEAGNVTVLNGEHVEPTSDVLLVLGQKEITVNGDKTSRSKDEGNNIVAPKIDADYPSSKSEILEQKEAAAISQEKDFAVNIIQVRKEVTPETDSASSVKSTVHFHSDDEEHENVHVLLVPDNMHAVENAEVVLGEFKDHRLVKFQQPVTLSSPELLNLPSHALEEDLRLKEEPNKTKPAIVDEGDATKNGRIVEDVVVTLDSQEDSNGDDKVVDVAGPITSISAKSDHGVEADTTKNFGESTIDAEPLESSAAAERSHSEKFAGVSCAVCLQGDMSVESGSQEDSLEGNWGSISALSMRSDNPAAMNTEALPLSDLRKSVAEKAEPVMGRDTSTSYHSDKSDTFEAPSFMRWVKPGALKATPEQAGWFPLLANVANVSPGRKKNEERIAKVANWSMKSPVRSGENPVVDGNETKTTTAGTVLSSEAHFDETRTTEAAQEWSSPVRHSAEIKRERKRVKPYWAQLLCCSASPVNY